MRNLWLFESLLRNRRQPEPEPDFFLVDGPINKDTIPRGVFFQMIQIHVTVYEQVYCI